MAVNDSCSVPGDTCSEPGGRITSGMCQVHYLRDRRHGSPTAGGTPRGALRSFAVAASSYTGDECLIWPYSTNVKGYGMLSYESKTWLAPRLVLWLAVGPPPESGMEACHRPGICHNRLCVNPQHLYWGTSRDNSADMLLDGTRPQGESHAFSRLSDAQVYAIRSDPRPSTVIAREYGISTGNVGSIKRRESWRHLPELDPNYVPGQSFRPRKLTEEQVYAIRADQRTYEVIAAEYGISIGTVCDIKKRRTWAHLPERPVAA